MEAVYTFSKAIDLGADYTNTAYDADSRLSRSQWEFETQKDRKALSRFDQPHSFLLRASYDFPKKHRGWMGRAFNNWIASGVLLVRKGTPFAVTTFDGPGYGNVDGNGGDRPNILDTSILGRTVGNPDTSVSLLPVSAFGFMQPTDHGGDLGVNTFRRGGIHNLNAAVSQNMVALVRSSLNVSSGVDQPDEHTSIRRAREHLGKSGIRHNHEHIE